MDAYVVQWFLAPLLALAIGIFIYRKRKQSDIQRMLTADPFIIGGVFAIASVVYGAYKNDFTWIAVSPLFILACWVSHRLFGGLVYIVLYRTSWGLKGMDGLAKAFPRTLKAFFYVGIVGVLLFMAVFTWMLVDKTIELMTTPAATPAIQLVLPFPLKGAAAFPPLAWILGIFFIAAMHEFAHGVAARVHDIPLKSSGFAFLGVVAPIIPAAFVEPDEARLVKRPGGQQLSVFAAGPFVNIVFGVLLAFVCGYALMLVPWEGKGVTLWDVPAMADRLSAWDGLTINGVVPESPAAKAGLAPGDVIRAVDNIPVSDRERLLSRFEALKPYDGVRIDTDRGPFLFVAGTSPTDKERGWMGLVSLETIEGPSQAAVGRYGLFTTLLGLNIAGFIKTLWILSIGIGMFNLLPLGPVDGGRMFRLLSMRIFGERRGSAVWKYVGVLLLALIIINLAVGFFR